MTLDKLAKQLRRDMAANPKKAAALGLMLLVAAYFWGPLVLKAVSSAGSKRSGKMDTANLILTDDPTEPTQQSRARTASKFRWERVRQLMQQDASMTSATFDPTWVDPFARSAQEIAMEQQAPNEATAAEQAVANANALEDVSLVLGGTFVGTKNRVATINGEARHEGDTFVVTGKDDKTISQKVRLLAISRQGVVLDVGGRRITIELAQPSLAQGDEILKQKPQFTN